MTFDDLRQIKGINNERAIYFDSNVPRYLEIEAEYATFEMLASLLPAEFAEMLSVDEADRNVAAVQEEQGQDHRSQ